MSLFQDAVTTYETLQDHVGIYEEDEKEPLAPIGHLITKINIIVTIDAAGNFIRAESTEKKVIIPVTEESSSRTSGVAAHPLCDQIGYLSGDNEKKYDEYIEHLKEWCASKYSNSKIQAVLNYVRKKTIISDLRKVSLLKENNGNVQNEKDLVGWDVIGLGDDSGPVWTDATVIQSWVNYVMSSETGNEDVCYINGTTGRVSDKHLKGIVPQWGNAKLISANDKTNYTYRGRFTSPDQAVSVSFQASQEANNALKYCVSNYGVSYGSRVFVSWSPEGVKVNSPLYPLMFKEELNLSVGDYRKTLSNLIMGKMSDAPDNTSVVVASFTAATSGRLSVSYYNKLLYSDFLERLQKWDESCCCINGGFGVQSPSLNAIAQFAHGTYRSGSVKSNFELDDKVVGQHLDRLIACRLSGGGIPSDFLRGLVNHAGRLLIYDENNRRKLLFVTCAVMRKYYHDFLKEEYDMSLEPSRNDRSYQFGRLLAVMEKCERDTYSNDEKREPNAIQMQSVFTRRPAYATKIIMEKLKSAYYPRLSVSSRVYYDRLIGEIMENISASSEPYEAALSETYLLGYYLQKNALYRKKESDEENN